LPLDALRPDEANRRIVLDEALQGLADSIAIGGVLQPILVKAQADDAYLILDGERRWRAARLAGRQAIPCDVWPKDVHPRDALIAGIAINEHRQAHGVLDVARRLRQIKNQFAETHEEVARRTGISLDRVKSYASLWSASDCLLKFFEEKTFPLTLAVEFVRYERQQGEVAARRLCRRYLEAPFTQRELAVFRKRLATARDAAADSPPTRRRAVRFAARLDAALTQDSVQALRELEEILGRYGYTLTPNPGAAR
jgi:ParB family chromosome partitioning protein